MNDIKKAQDLLLSNKTPITQKMRALFYLKNIKTNESAEILSKVFNDNSVLLKHEAAYVLGQMRLDISKTVLIDVLNDKNQDEIVRHEAGEALGNFLEHDDLDNVINKHLDSKSIPVKETCYLAHKKREEYKNMKNKDPNFSDTTSLFDSIDPAFPFNNLSFDEISKIFLDKTACLYQRYKALLSLRNFMTKEAVEILGKGFDDESALFKHEIAFVFGQMRKTESIKFLASVLEKESEHGMVRHECAEALGSIGTEESLESLNPFLKCPVDVVRESVEVALDIHDYVSGNDAEYAAI